MTAPLVRAVQVVHDHAAPDHVALSYEARLIRRKRLEATSGRPFLVDLPEVISVNQGDAFVLEDDSRIGVIAAPEPVLKITGDLTRLAWHIGNRHAPCQIEADHLIIADNHVLADMLAHLGAGVAPLTAPFTPEGGAYGHGRTFAHSHD